MLMSVASVCLLVATATTLEAASQVAGQDQWTPSTLRQRRQISYPQLGGGPAAPQVAPQPPPPPPQTGGVFQFLSDLGPQVESAKMLSSLFSGPSATGSQQQPGSPQQPSSGPSAGQIMSQLSELIRTTQDRSAKMVANGQEQVAAAGQQTLQATQGAQTGIQSALAELGASVQRLASNNPNLLPDLRNLYQSVSSKLMSSSPASGQQQFANNLAKAAGQ